MSRIYFTSLDGEVEILGRERAHMGVTVDNMTTGLFAHIDQPRVSRFIKPGHYLHGTDQRAWHESFRTAWGVGGSGLGLTIDGEVHHPWHISLQTAVDVGGDPLNLFARIHATCEIHGYFAGEHRSWVADIIEQGRKIGLYRANMGWEGLVEFLRSNSTNPVVMSYSVCDGFPNPYVAGVETNDEEETQEEIEWYDLPFEEQFDRAFKGLVASNSQVDIHPDTFHTRGFGYEVNAFWFLDQVYREEPLDKSVPRHVGSPL